jgi:hypothetical protein
MILLLAVNILSSQEWKNIDPATCYNKRDKRFAFAAALFASLNRSMSITLPDENIRIRSLDAYNCSSSSLPLFPLL